MEDGRMTFIISNSITNFHDFHFSKKKKKIFIDVKMPYSLMDNFEMYIKDINQELGGNFWTNYIHIKK